MKREDGDETAETRECKGRGVDLWKRLMSDQ
jgi:hypothetical protein